MSSNANRQQSITPGHVALDAPMFTNRAHHTMRESQFVSSDTVRNRFSQAMSRMYRDEVPQYGSLLQLVSEVNACVLTQQPALATQLRETGDIDRLDIERHGAIRLGTAAELATMRRLFAVMGMEPVGYYDLSVAGVPVHSTAFRPTTDAALTRNPFRVFTSLLRLELIPDEALRCQAATILERRQIFTDRALALIAQFEQAGGLIAQEVDEFVTQALQTFRWHADATVDAETYEKLQQTHRLIADVVCFKGPHINHLTPRTLDIDAAQAAMPGFGINAKDLIEGPPRRRCPILLRQTSFKALEEKVLFQDGTRQRAGTHTARFGEIEQRGIALTRAGRQRYDQLLATVQETAAAGETAAAYANRLAQAFNTFPDDEATLRREGLGFFRYALTAQGRTWAEGGVTDAVACVDGKLEVLIAEGWVRADPIIYEDFLPVSAAGIFQSNLGGTARQHYAVGEDQAAFEAALGAPVHDEIALYAAAQARSIEQVRAALRQLSEA
jgi:uncharacterized glyoxalase superfamily metalloenzyme YdcJ